VKRDEFFRQLREYVQSQLAMLQAAEECGDPVQVEELLDTLLGDAEAVVGLISSTTPE
jgi:hypothetical protein